MDRTQSTTTAAAVAGLVLGLAGAVHAADTYSACFKISTSKIRNSSVVVNATPTCKATETLHTWNQEGPQGPGLTTCAPVQSTATCNANTFAVMNLSCPSGQLPTGASAIWHTPFDAADNGPFYILPRFGGWTVVPYNHTGTAQDFTFFVQCCS